MAELASKGPARRAGIKAGDVLRRVDGKEVNQLSDLRAILQGRNIGDEVTVEIERNGRKESYQIRLEEAKE